jgi:hypothetical protein
MATSGTYVWTENRDQVIKGALRKLAVLPSGGSPSTNQTTDATEALNALMKALNAEGMPLWAVTSYSFNPVVGTNSYTIGIGQTLNTAAPLKLIQARRLDSGSTVAVPMNIYNRYDFNLLPNQSTITGTPVSVYYQPILTSGSVDAGTLKLWPYPDSATPTIYLDYIRPFQDMTSSTDNLDFPPYWTNALIYNLAWLLAPEYGIPPTDRNLLAEEAKFWKDEALSFGSEEGSLFMQPDMKPK